MKSHQSNRSEIVPRIVAQFAVIGRGCASEITLFGLLALGTIAASSAGEDCRLPWWIRQRRVSRCGRDRGAA